MIIKHELTLSIGAALLLSILIRLGLVDEYSTVPSLFGLSLTVDFFLDICGNGHS